MKNNQDSLKYWSKTNKWFINAYKNSWIEELIHGPVKLREQCAVSVAKLINSKTILDLGCGPCRVLSRALKETNAENAIGLDFSKSMLEESRKHLESLNLSTKVLLKEADLIKIRNYPKADISFGLGIFDYIEDPKIILKKAHESSNYLVASWPAPNFRNFLRKFRYSCPIYTYSKNDIVDLFNQINIHSVDFISAGGFSGYITISKKY